MANFFQSRQAKQGSYAGAYILVFLAILGAVNYLADQYNKTYDATEENLYSLSDQTEKILDELPTDATIYHFDQKSRFDGARNSLVRYENASSRVKVSYIDPDSDPATAQAMNIRTYGTTLVEVGAKREEAKSTSEEDVTNALIKALKGGDKKACVLSGHGEASPDDSEREGFSAAQTEIEGSNYETETISLLENPQIPAACSMLIVAGPQSAYLPQEVEILKRYVETGGRLLLLIDHTQSPELVELAAGWGIEVHDDVVVDMSGIGQLFGGSPLAPLVAEYDSLHPITKVMGNVGTFMPMVRSVSRADSQPDGWDATELLKTTSGSFATRELKVEDGELARNPDWETAGPINLAVAATYAVPKSDDDAGAGEDEAAPGEEILPPDDEEKQGRVVVVGTSRFTRNYSIGLGGNLDLLLNMVSWLTSDEDLISIRPKDPKSTPMDISASGMRNIFYGLVLGLPFVIIVAGVRTWWVRR